MISTFFSKSCFMQDARSHDMTLEAMWERYLYTQDDCIEAARYCRQHGVTPEYIEMSAVCMSLRAIVFIQTPGLPNFPWAPK